MLFQYLQSALDLVPEDEVVVRFILCDVSDPDKFWMFPITQQLFFYVLTRQVLPADNAGDEIVLVGKFQAPVIFCQVMLCLDQDRTFNPGRLDSGQQILWQKIAIYRLVSPSFHFAVVQHRGLALQEMVGSVNDGVGHESQLVGVGRESQLNRFWTVMGFSFTAPCRF